MIILRFIQGFFMALADSVPGVSGGTIAFIMGFYDDFINSINTLISRTKTITEKKAALIFLAKLGIGWGIGLTLSVFILATIFEQEIYKISSLFTGLILFSIPLIISEEKDTLKSKYKYLIYTLLGCGVVYLITYISGQISRSTGDVNSNFTLAYGIYIFFAGMIAISAMVLPGISGSSFLLIFGVYSTVIVGVKETLSFNFTYLPLLIFFGFGVLTGAALFIGLLRYLLDHYRPHLVYLILGLMIGSIYAVIIGPTTLDVPKPAMTFDSFNIFFFLIGGLIIYGLDRIKVLMSKYSQKLS